MNTTAKRTVTVLTRYQIKKSGVFNGVNYLAGSIVLFVENDCGELYTVTLRANKVHSCTCEGNAKHHKRCYHITDCAARENARAKREKAAREIEAICVEAERGQVVPEVAPVLAPVVPEVVPEVAPVAARKAVPARDLAPLNGNQGFSFMRRENVRRAS